MLSFDGDKEKLYEKIFDYTGIQKKGEEKEYLILEATVV